MQVRCPKNRGNISKKKLSDEEFKLIAEGIKAYSLTGVKGEDFILEDKHEIDREMLDFLSENHPDRKVEIEKLEREIRVTANSSE